MKTLPKSILRNAVILNPPPKTKSDFFIVYVSETGDEPWRPVHRDDVPEWVKAPDVMGQLYHGMIVSCQSSPLHYRAERQTQH